MDKVSEFAVHEAARDGRISVVESLLSANPKLADFRDNDGRLPIHWAISYGHKEIVTLLASTKNFDVDVQDGSGWTPLMIAVSLKEGEEIVYFLLGKGADVNAKNFAGQTALHFIASKRNIDYARRLLEAHSPPASTRIKDRRGHYPIHRAAAVGSVPLVEIFIKHRSPINVADVAGQTPLHHAVAEGHGDTAVALLKAGAEANKRDSDDKLALELAPDSTVMKYILRAAESEGIEL